MRVALKLAAAFCLLTLPASFNTQPDAARALARRQTTPSMSRPEAPPTPKPRPSPSAPEEVGEDDTVRAEDGRPLAHELHGRPAEEREGRRALMNF